MTVQRNNSFVNQTRLALLCEKSGAILLVLVGLTAGSQMKYQYRFENFIGRIVIIFT